MKMREDAVVSSSVRRITRRQLQWIASVFNKWPRNFAPLRSLLISSLCTVSNSFSNNWW